MSTSSQSSTLLGKRSQPEGELPAPALSNVTSNLDNSLQQLSYLRTSGVGATAQIHNENRHPFDLKGVCASLFVPFKADLSVNYEAIPFHVSVSVMVEGRPGLGRWSVNENKHRQLARPCRRCSSGAFEHRQSTALRL